MSSILMSSSNRGRSGIEEGGEGGSGSGHSPYYTTMATSGVGAGGNHDNGIRRYLVLMQDSLAIKFVPILQQSQHDNDKGDMHLLMKGATLLEKDDDVNDGRRMVASKESVGSYVKMSKFLATKNKCLKGIILFEEFIQANQPCVWNSELHDAIMHMEYKGIILPSTILFGICLDPSWRNNCSNNNNSPTHDDEVTSLNLNLNLHYQNVQKYLAAIKLAWERKVLRSPPGHRIEFVGEIEELLADPVEPSNFIPLSDSLCWAIHELTSTGQESFLDGIMKELRSSFPGTVLPPKELLYQILERLTKAKKIYQTSQGYFIEGGSSPSSCCPFPNGDNKNEGSHSPLPPPSPTFSDSDGDIYHKADRAGEGNAGAMKLKSSESFKRCNSLRNSIKKYERVTGCLPRRTFSLRSHAKTPKVVPNNEGDVPSKKSVPQSQQQQQQQPAAAKSGSGTVVGNCGSENSLSTSVESLVLDKRRKHKSFLKNLLTFRRSVSAPSPSSSTGNGTKSKSAKKNKLKKLLSVGNDEVLENLRCREMSTQTSRSLENLQDNFNRLLSVSMTPSPTSANASSSGNSSSGSHSHTPSPTLGLDGDSSPTSSGKLERRGERTTAGDSDSGRYTESSEPDVNGKEGFSPKQTNLATPLTCSIAEEEQLNLPPLPTTPTPTLSLSSPTTSTRPPSRLSTVSPNPSQSSSASYLFNNPYRRRYLNYQNYYSNNFQPPHGRFSGPGFNNYSSASTPTPSSNAFGGGGSSGYGYGYYSGGASSIIGGASNSGSGNSGSIRTLPKYPPRPFEKKQIFERLSSPTTGSSSSSTGSSIINRTPLFENKKLFYPSLGSRQSVTSVRSGNTNGSQNCTGSTTLVENNSKGVSGTTATTTTTTTTTTTFLKPETNSNVQIEVLLPLGKLINQVLTDFEDRGNKRQTARRGSKVATGHPEDVAGNKEGSGLSSGGNNNDTSASSTVDVDKGDDIKQVDSPTVTNRERAATTNPSPMPILGVNDLFTFKSFLQTKSNLSNGCGSIDSQADVEFTTQLTRTLLSNNNNNHVNNKLKTPKQLSKNACGNQATRVEKVSFKPVVMMVEAGGGCTNGSHECRESEII